MSPTSTSVASAIWRQLPFFVWLVALWMLLWGQMFFLALIRGSLLVAWQTLDPRRYPGAAVIAVPLRTDDDLIMAHVGVTASLIPGSLIVDVDRDRRILYLHVIGISSDRDVEKQRRAVQGWESRIVRAVGSRAQLEAIRAAGAQTPREGGAAL